MPFYPAANDAVQPAAVPGVVACRCCPGGISRSRRTCRYPSDMSQAEWAVCEPLLPHPPWLEAKGGRWAMIIVMTRRLARKPASAGTTPEPQVT